MIKLLSDSFANEPGEMQFIEAWCKLHHAGDCILVIIAHHYDSNYMPSIDPETGETVRSDYSEVEELMREFDLENPETRLNDYVLYQIPENMVRPILTFAHDRKWAIGSSLYIWNKQTLIFGRD